MRSNKQFCIIIEKVIFERGGEGEEKGTYRTKGEE